MNLNMLSHGRNWIRNLLTLDRTWLDYKILNIIRFLDEQSPKSYVSVRFVELNLTVTTLKVKVYLNSDIKNKMRQR